MLGKSFKVLFDNNGGIMVDNCNKDIAVFAGGCFWCLEAVFSMFDGIIEIVPGYAGGHTKNPSYEEVCRGDTGHAEAVRITFDPSVITYHKLLQIFFSAHNPTTLNRQGDDIGSQYRSAIFYCSSEQQSEALQYIQEVTNKGLYKDPIVTEVVQLESFYEAEKYHHQYFKNHPDQAYCQLAIHPKISKIKKEFNVP